MSVTLFDILLQWVFSPKPKWKVGDRIMYHPMLESPKRGVVVDLHIQYKFFSYTIWYSIKIDDEKWSHHPDVRCIQDRVLPTKSEKRDKRIEELLQ